MKQLVFAVHTCNKNDAAALVCCVTNIAIKQKIALNSFTISCSSINHMLSNISCNVLAPVRGRYCVLMLAEVTEIFRPCISDI